MEVEPDEFRWDKSAVAGGMEGYSGRRLGAMANRFDGRLCCRSWWSPAVVLTMRGNNSGMRSSKIKYVSWAELSGASCYITGSDTRTRCPGCEDNSLFISLSVHCLAFRPSTSARVHCWWVRACWRHWDSRVTTSITNLGPTWMRQRSCLTQSSYIRPCFSSQE